MTWIPPEAKISTPEVKKPFVPIEAMTEDQPKFEQYPITEGPDTITAPGFSPQDTIKGEAISTGPAKYPMEPEETEQTTGLTGTLLNAHKNAYDIVTSPEKAGQWLQDLWGSAKQSSLGAWNSIKRAGYEVGKLAGEPIIGDYSPEEKAKRDEHLKSNLDELNKQKAAIEEYVPVYKSAGYIGGSAPYVAMATASLATGSGEIALGSKLAFAALGIGEGANAYDKHVAKTGEPENKGTKALTELLYGSLYTVPIAQKLGKYMPKQLIGRILGKEVLNPEVQSVAGKIAFETFAKEQPSLAKQYLSTALKGIPGSVAGMETMMLGTKVVDEKVIGDKVSWSEYGQTAVHAALTGIAFHVAVTPFAVMAQNRAIAQRWDRQGSVSITLDDKGRSVEVLPTQEGKKQQGMRPNGQIVDVTSDQVKNAFIVPTELLKSELGKFKTTGQAGPTIERDAFSGRVTDMTNRLSDKDGNILTGKDKDGNNFYLIGKDAQGNNLVIDSNGKPAATDPTIQWTKVNKGEVWQSLMNNYDQKNAPQQAPPQGLGGQPTQPVTPRDQTAQQAQQFHQQHADKNTGLLRQIHEVTPGEDPNKTWFVTQEINGGEGNHFYFVEDGDGNYRQLSASQIAEPNSEEPNNISEQEYVDTMLSQFDMNEQAKTLSANNTMEYDVDGKKVILERQKATNEEGDVFDSWIGPDGMPVEVPEEDTKAWDKAREFKPDLPANIVKRTFEKTSVTGTKDEAGNIIVSEPMTKEQAEGVEPEQGKEKKDFGFKGEVEKATNKRMTVKVDPIDNTDASIEVKYQVSIIPAPVVKSPDTLAPPPAGQMPSGTMTERKVVTQKFGTTDLDIVEHEGYDEVVPTEKVSLEKALPVLEKKFKDHKKFKLEVEKVQVEIPAETKYDDPTYKTVIKSIKIVPKNVNNSENKSEKVPEIPTEKSGKETVANTTSSENEQKLQENENAISESSLIKETKGENTNPDIAYHGTPYNYESFDANKIGTGEGASKRGKGMYFMRGKKFAPFFANINSEDAPIHIGRGGEKADKSTIDPKILTVSGIESLNLKKGSEREIGSWSNDQERDVENGFDGYETPKGEITVFPESIWKLKIESKNSIEDFVTKNSDVEYRTWTTNKERESALKPKQNESTKEKTLQINPEGGQPNAVNSVGTDGNLESEIKATGLLGQVDELAQPASLAPSDTNSPDSEAAAVEDINSRVFTHETNAKTFDKFDLSKAGSGQGDQWLGRGIYLQEKGSFKIETYGKNIIEVVLKPNAKIFEVKDSLNGIYGDNFVEWAVKNTGIGKRKAQERMDDGLDLNNLLPRDILRHSPEAVEKLKEEGYDGLYQDGELVIYNTEVLQIIPKSNGQSDSSVDANKTAGNNTVGSSKASGVTKTSNDGGNEANRQQGEVVEESSKNQPMGEENNGAGDKGTEGVGETVAEEVKSETVESFNDLKRYNSTINVGERYYDNRYGDNYTIESITPFGEMDADVVCKYDKGKTRIEKASFILYHIDAKQHSLVISQVPEEVKQETAKEVTKELAKEKKDNPEVIYKEQKKQILEDLRKAEDILLGVNREKTRKYEQEWIDKKFPRDQYDNLISSSYQYDAETLPIEGVKELEKAGIKVIDHKRGDGSRIKLFEIDVYRDGTIRVGDLRTAMRITEKGFPAREKSYGNVPISTNPKAKEIAKGLKSQAEADRLVQVAEDNVAEAVKGGLKGMIELTKRQLQDAKDIQKEAEKIDYPRYVKAQKMVADKEFMEWRNKPGITRIKDEYNISDERLYDLVQGKNLKELSGEQLNIIALALKLKGLGLTVDQSIDKHRERRDVLRRDRDRISGNNKSARESRDLNNKLSQKEDEAIDFLQRNRYSIERELNPKEEAKPEPKTVISKTETTEKKDGEQTVGSHVDFTYVDGSQQSGTITAINGEKATIKGDDGIEYKVKTDRIKGEQASVDSEKKPSLENGAVSAKQFTFMADSPMHQARALTVLDKQIRADGVVMTRAKWIESMPEGLVVENTKIYSNKAKTDDGSVMKLVIGDNIVDSKAEQDYYTYIQNGGYPYSAHLADLKAEEIKNREEQKKISDEKHKRDQAEAERQNTEVLKTFLSETKGVLIEKFTKTNRNLIAELESKKQTKNTIEEIELEKKILQEKIKSISDRHNTVNRIYSLKDGDIVKNFDYKVGDNVSVHNNGSIVKTKIESINGTNFKVEKVDGIYNQYQGYESLMPVSLPLSEELAEAKKKTDSEKAIRQYKGLIYEDSVSKYKYTVIGSNAGYLTLEDVDTGKIKRVKEEGEEWLNNFIDVTHEVGQEQKGITSESSAVQNSTNYDVTQFEDNVFDVQEYGRKDSPVYHVVVGEAFNLDNSVITKDGKPLKKNEKVDNNVLIAIQNHVEKFNPESKQREIKKFLAESDHLPDTGKKVDHPVEPTVKVKTLEEELRESKEKVEGKKNEPIVDFGEKVGGAKKDIIRKYFNKINLNGTTLSTIFPKPDIKGLLETGLSVKDVSAIKVAYEFAIAEKKRGADRIKFCAAYAKNILAESINLEFSNNNYVFTDHGKALLTIRTDAFTKVAEKLGSEYLNLDLTKFQIKELTENDIKAYVKKPEGKFEVRYYVNPRTYFDTIDEAMNEFVEQVKKNTTTDKIEYKRKISVYYSRYDKAKANFLAFKPSGKDLIVLKDGFKHTNEAFQYLKDNEADLHTMLERILAETKSEKKTTVTRLNYLNENTRERVGNDWRKGKDITPKEFADQFGFRAIEFGNWATQKERQIFMNGAYDAMMDLAGIINVPPRAMSLGGNLALSFGSRGSGDAMAHYEPDKRVIGLTKTRGVGSLAHEWFHAMDNSFAGFKFNMKGMNSATQADFAPDTRPEIKEAFKKLVEILKSSEFAKRSQTLDNTKSKEYFSLKDEMGARAFENYILNKLSEAGQVNDFLVNHVSSENWNGKPEQYPFPIGEETKAIAKVFDKVFETIQTKEENGNTMMFEPSKEYGKPKLLEDFLHEAKEKVSLAKTKGMEGSRRDQADYYADKISAIVKELGRENYNPSVSVTDFGTSIYVQNQGYGKIRFSDHSVSNYDRIWDESHWPLSALENPIQDVKDDIERVLFPERYKIFTVKNNVGEDVSAPRVKKSELENVNENPFKLEYFEKKVNTGPFEVNDKGLRETDEILNSRLSNNGTKTVYSISRLEEKPFKKIIDARTGKTVKTDIPLNSKEVDKYYKDKANKAIPPTISINGVSRPTTNSKGQVIHPTREGIENFYAWFKNSKVVDAEGRPLVVYHGTFGDFDTFKNESTAYFFAESKEYAKQISILTNKSGKSSQYVENRPQKIIEAYLSIERPKDYRGTGQEINTNLIDHLQNSYEYLRDMNDGAIGYDVGSKKETTYAAFSPSQIKSATGNDGSFSPDNNSILNEPENNYNPDVQNSKKSTILAVNEKKRTYKTKEGEAIQYTLFSDTNDGTKPGDVQRKGSSVQSPSLRRLNEGERASVEQKYTLDKNFVFDGRNKIESTDDIAYLFRQLENKSIENMFACLVKDGKATVIHLSMGTQSATIMNFNALSDAVNRFNPDKVYLIHNHPSGNLDPSSADFEIHRRAVQAYGNIIQEHVIIDRTTGKYASFRLGLGDHDIKERPKFASYAHEDNPTDLSEIKNYKVLQFDKQVFTEDTTLPIISQAADVAKFVSAQRFTDGNKLSAIILSSNLTIKAYLHLPSVDFRNPDSIKALVKELQAYAGRFGGNRIILTGNTDISDGASRFGLNRVKESLKASDIDLADVIHVHSYGYKSMADNGLMEPTVKYGDGMVHDPSVPLGTELETAKQINEKTKDVKRSFKEIMTGIRKNIQDGDLVVRRFEEKIKEMGGKITDRMKPYRQLNLSFGRMETLYQEFADNMMKPIIGTIHKIRKVTRITPEYIAPYTIAKQALERNPKMRIAEFEKWMEEHGHDFEAWWKTHPSATITQQDKWFDDREKYKEDLWRSLQNKDYSGVTPFDSRQQAVNKDMKAWSELNPDADAKETAVKHKELVALHQPLAPDVLAQQIVDQFEAEVPKDLVDELWKNIKVATDNTVKTWYKSGEITKEARDEYLAEKNFVPLRGWQEGDANQLLYSKGDGFSRSFQHAEGRKSIAGNPLAFIQKVAFDAISEQVLNESKIQLLNLVVNNYEPKFQKLYKLKKAYYVKTVDPDGTDVWILSVDPRTNELVKPDDALFKSGEAKTVLNRQHEQFRSRGKAGEHEVIIRNPLGDQVIVMLGNNLEIAQSMNRRNTMSRYLLTGTPFDTQDWNGPMKRVFSPVTRFMTSAMTQWNVTFPFRNFSRDAIEASITQSIKGEHGAQVIKNYSHSFPSIMRALAGKQKVGNKYDDYNLEFYEAGGSTGYTHNRTPEEVEKHINKELDRMMRDGTITGTMRNLPFKMLHGIATWNMIFEDATRLSVYITARENGKTIKQAASEAKEASVNFNRTGKMSKSANSLYGFFNATVQAGQKNFSLFKHYPKRAIGAAVAFATLGFMESMMNNLLPGDDDDDNYWNISEYMRQNYLILPNFPKLIKQLATGEKVDKGDMYMSFPLPQFWRAFKSLGSLSYEAGQGRITWDQVATKFMSNAIVSLTPFDLPGIYQDGKFNPLRPFIPTMINPMVQVAENRNYMGFTIANEPFTKAQKDQLADSGLGKANVNPAIKWFTDALFRSAGGDNETKFYTDENGNVKKVWDVADFNPSKIEHLVTGYTAGTGKFVMDILKTGYGVITPDHPIDFKDMPFVNAFIRKTPEAKWTTIREYYDLKKEIEGVDVLAKAYYNQGDYDKFADVVSNEYYAKYAAIVNGLDKAVQTAMDNMDYKTASGSDEVLNRMKESIDQVKELKKEYNR